ncbi:MAG: hypothetical protein KJS98_01835 [Nitrospirae bacterium]|nr:hypothetical protein [Nitrospirota bacterium]MDE3049255.1 hypothetical protein [Nitrospirota bacterium]
MSSLASRPTVFVPARWGFFISTETLFAVVAFVLLAGCGPSVNRYLLIEASLRAHDPKGADAIVQRDEKEYGEKSRVLYGMDRGMTLQLAGDYQQSNTVLDQAEEEVDRLYTRKIRTESLAFMTNDTALPYEGDPYEQVLINVLKALNYAVLGQWQDALVEARRIDHRLDVLSDRTRDKNAYRDDGFARYLSGILYESTGDVNNAFISYRNAYEVFESSRVWSHTAVPSQLRVDLLRTAEALHFTQELTEYQHRFPDTRWETSQALQQLAQVIVISYNGRAPRKEDLFLDLPISLDALQLVLLNRGFSQANRQSNQVVDTVLYGLNGRVVRVALPRLVPQKTHVPVDTVSLIQDNGTRVTLNTQLVQSVTALADKALSERMPGITAKALARAATKFAMAEGATRGAQHAAGRDAAPWVGLLVGLLTKGLAVASEEADKRSWQTLPDEIHLARVWVPPGRYQVQSQSPGGSHDLLKPEALRTLSLGPGETTVLIQRVMP